MILSYSLNSVRKRPKRFLREGYVGCLKYSLSEYFDMCWHEFFDMWLNSVRKRLKRFLREGFLFICKRKIHHKGRKWFFPTVSIRSESVQNYFSEKVFVKIKMIHISMLSYCLNLVWKRLKWFLEKVFVKITQFRVCPSSVSIDYTLLLGARRSCGQWKIWNGKIVQLTAIYPKLR